MEPSTQIAVREVGEADFQQQVLDRSRSVPVVVDFWAAWCAPCRVLGPVLEKLAVEAEGSWVLAKVDVDANPRLAAAARVQGIPAVRAFRDGKQVAEFTGALPEDQVRAWLSKLGPSASDLKVEQGLRARDAGRLDEAGAAFRAALAQEPGHEAAKRGLAQVELAERVAAGSTADDPLGRADRDVAEGRVDEAFARLLEVIRGAEPEMQGLARQRLLSLFDAMEPGDPRVDRARMELNRALF